MIKYLLFVLASILAATAVFFFRQIKLPPFSFGISFFELFSIVKQPKMWVGVMLYGVAFLFFLYIVHSYEVSSAVPSLLGTYIIVLALMGHFILGEEVILQKIVAYSLIIAGIALL